MNLNYTSKPTFACLTLDYFYYIHYKKASFSYSSEVLNRIAWQCCCIYAIQNDKGNWSLRCFNSLSNNKIDYLDNITIS